MSTTEFRHVRDVKVLCCDVCDTIKRDTSAVRIVRNESAGPYIQNVCMSCALEITGVVLKLLLDSGVSIGSASLLAARDPPPPEPKRSGGGQ